MWISSLALLSGLRIQHCHKLRYTLFQLEATRLVVHGAEKIIKTKKLRTNQDFLRLGTWMNNGGEGFNLVDIHDIIINGGKANCVTQYVERLFFYFLFFLSL